LGAVPRTEGIFVPPFDFVIFLFAGYKSQVMEEYKYGWWLPPDLSVHGAGIDQLINVVHVLMAVMFFGWGAFLVYCLVKFRERPGHRAIANEKTFRFPFWVESAVATIEVGLLAFVSSPIWYHVKTGFPAEKDALVVHVIAEQYAWNFHYPGGDGKFGLRRRELISPSNPIGLDRSDAAAKDDIVSINNLHIPVGKPVIAHLSSKDVIHSFFIPVLRVKQDVIPGMTIKTWFQAKKSGQGFEIACAQLCGLGHYRMMGLVSIDTPEEYLQWLQEEQKLLEEENA